MTRPQQQELARSERTPVDQDEREEHITAEEVPASGGNTGRVPEANRSGHHPEREQDKPEALGGAGHGKKKRRPPT